MSSNTSAWAQSPLLHSALGYSCSILPRLSLLAQKRQVSGQPPIAHIQPYRHACPVRTAALDQPLGINAVYYRPAVDIPVFAQYHISTHSCMLLHTLIHGYPVIIQASATFLPKDIRLVHTHASYSNQLLQYAFPPYSFLCLPSPFVLHHDHLLPPSLDDQYFPSWIAYHFLRIHT
jgi:hypothetical protein